MSSIINNLVVVFVVINNYMATRGGAKTTLHKVGDAEYGWNPNLNYTLWSSSHHFHVGDWLYFGFDKRYYNVLEVNETSYEACNDEGFINNVTRGGRDVFELTEARPYYFLSSGGYCFHGMRVAVFVAAAAERRRGAPTARPAVAPSPALLTYRRPYRPGFPSVSASRDNRMRVFVVLSMYVIFFFAVLV